MPLAQWTDAQIKTIAALTGSTKIAALSGAAILGMRATRRRPDSCRFYEASDGHVALNLARSDDTSLLPALFGDADFRIGDIAAHMAQANAVDVVARGRALGLAIAHLEEQPVSPACVVTAEGLAAPPKSRRPVVIDLSALWAGPLAGHLLMLAESDVIKVESGNRPDAMRTGDAALFARLNGGKERIALDLRAPEGRDALIALIRHADFVIEAARPRALLQLGIDADQLVREVPGLVWVTITGHGVSGEAANWIGFGDDCGVAGGLSAAKHRATGEIGFVGDAIADPLTGLYAARMALKQRERGFGARMVLSMSAVAAKALAETETPISSC